MKRSGITNKGLLPLGLIVALSLTLSGFEYMNADLKYNRHTTSKLDKLLEDEIIYEDVEIEKPEVPKPEVPIEKPQVTPAVTPPATPVGPIEISEEGSEEEQEFNFREGEIDPLPEEWGKQRVIIDPPPSDPLTMEEFPTYKKFQKIKDREERRVKTEAKIKSNINSVAKYPEIPKQMGIQGTVYVSFIVDKDGSIKDVAVTRGVHPDLDAEAIRAVNRLPEMIPGKQWDKPVKVRYNIPVTFRLK